jgi:hypothetical protein
MRRGVPSLEKNMRQQSDFFTYLVPVLALAPAAVSTQILTFDAASNFEWLYSCYTADVAAAGQTVSTRTYPLANVLITPSDSSSQLMSAALPLTGIFGNAENPFVLPTPRIIEARSAIQFQVTNRDAAQTYNLFLMLIGRKVFL